MATFNWIVFEKNRIFIFTRKTVSYVSMNGERILLFALTYATHPFFVLIIKRAEGFMQKLKVASFHEEPSH